MRGSSGFDFIRSIHFATCVLLRHFRIKIFAVSCLVAFYVYADMCTDKAIWICKRMIRWMWASARTRMQFENGYVNRFGCRLFAAYFLPNGFASLFCNSFRFLYSTCCYCWFTFLYAPANRSVQIVRRVFFACLLNCCMFARKLKCNDIYYIFTYHTANSTRYTIDTHMPWFDAGAAYANIIARFYFLSVMEINMLRPKRWLNALEMLVNCTIISHIITCEWENGSSSSATFLRRRNESDEVKLFRMDFSQLSGQEFDSIAKTIYVHHPPWMMIIKQLSKCTNNLK